MKTIEKCSCAESQHLRKALEEIHRINIVQPSEKAAEGADLYRIRKIEQLTTQGLRLRVLRNRSHG